MTPREISIANRHPRLRLDRRALTRALRVLDSEFPKSPSRNSPFAIPPPGTLSLVFLTDAALAQLHADFLDDPTITDVITFEGDPGFGTAGEICISADAALRQTGFSGDLKAQVVNLKSAATTAAFSRELTLYVVHGWLHLAGYDDLQPAKKRAMRRAETRALRLLHQASALPPFRLLP